jgi:anti-sigma factor RsiW
MACEMWRAKIAAYIDGELPAEEMRAFAAHLPSCPACTGESLGEVQWKRATQAAGKRYAPSAEFRRHIEEQIGARKRPAASWSWLPTLAVAAALLVVIFLGVNRWRESARAQVFAELTDLHTATLASATPVDVISTDRHTVKPWFEGKIPFTFNVPELAGTPFTLVGGRVAYLGQSAGAELLFQLRLHRISAFIFQDRPELTGQLPAAESLSKHESFTVDTWSDGGLRYFVIGDTAAADILQLSALLRGAR